MKNLLILTIVLGLALMPWGPALTETSVSAAAPDLPQPDPIYFLPLPAPSQQDLAQTQPGARYALFFQRQYQKTLNTLPPSLRSSPLVHFDPDPAAFGMRISLQTPGGLAPAAALRAELESIEGVQPLDALTTCDQQRGRPIQEQLEARAGAPSRPNAPLQAGAAPTIQIYMSSYSAWDGTRFARVDGQVGANAPVSLSARDQAGKTVLQLSAASDAAGAYHFVPDWDCDGWTWGLAPGLRITVASGGQSAEFQIPVIEATANMGAKIISGATAPERSIRIDVWQSAYTCNDAAVTIATQSGPDGRFQADLNPQGGFDNSGGFQVYVLDVKGNYAATTFWFPWLMVVSSSLFVGIHAYSLHPNVEAVLRLRRAGQVVETMETNTNGEGWVHTLFNSQVQDGDVIEFQAEDYLISYVYAQVSKPEFDKSTGLLSGNTRPGSKVLAGAEYYCHANDLCQITYANVSGDFQIQADPSLVTQMDYFELALIDGQGNAQYDPISMIHLVYSPDYQLVWGDWYFDTGDVLTYRVYSGSTIVFEASAEPVWSYGFPKVRYDLPFALTAGQRIEVSDSLHTRSLEVAVLQVQVVSDQHYLTGTSSSSRPLNILADGNTCGLAPGGGGSFYHSLDPSFIAGDGAGIHSYEADGDYVGIFRTDNSINLVSTTGQTGFSVNGYLATPEAGVSVSVLNASGQLRETQTVGATGSTSYEVQFNFELQSGDRLQVQSGPRSAIWTPPRLTLYESEAQNTLYGNGPANADLFLYLENPKYYKDITVQTDAAGNYLASLDAGCGDGQVGGCYRPVVIYNAPSGHSASLRGADRPPVTIDAYDAGLNDNAAERASVYIAAQSHTFHAGDPEDWVAVNIPAANVGRLYAFQTYNVGDAIWTDLALYDSDRTTRLAVADIYIDSSVIYWQPAHAGWHYVQIDTLSSSDGSCGSRYDFKIQLQAQWTALIYLNGDSDLGSAAGKARSYLENMAGSLQNTNVVLLFDGQDTTTGDTWRYLVQPNGSYTDGQNRWYMGELNLGSGDVLSDFLTWGMTNFPASHYYVSIVDHGAGLRGTSWDFNTYPGENSVVNKKNFDNSDRLTPLELNQALKRTVRNTGHKIDVLHYDSCLMGMWEHAYQVKDNADYLIFSQNEGWAVFAYNLYTQALNGRAPASAAQEIAKLYAQEVTKYGDYPQTISVIDLSKMSALREQIDALAGALTNAMGAQKLALQASRDAAQKLDSNYDYTLTADDSLVDLYNFAAQVKARIADPAVVGAANALQAAITQAVLYKESKTGSFNTPQGLRQMNLEQAHGLSTYFPKERAATFAIYRNNQLFDMTAETAWDDMLEAYFGALGLPPTTTDPDSVDPVIVTLNRIYLPVIRK